MEDSRFWNGSGLVCPLTISQSTLGDPAGSIKAPDGIARRFIEAHKPPRRDKALNHVGEKNGEKVNVTNM